MVLEASDSSSSGVGPPALHYPTNMEMGRGGLAASGLMVQCGVKLDTLTTNIKIGHKYICRGYRVIPHRSAGRCPDQLIRGDLEFKVHEMAALVDMHMHKLTTVMDIDMHGGNAGHSTRNYVGGSDNSHDHDIISFHYSYHNQE